MNVGQPEAGAADSFFPSSNLLSAPAHSALLLEQLPTACAGTAQQPVEADIQGHALYGDLVRAVVGCRQSIAANDKNEQRRLEGLQQAALRSAATMQAGGGGGGGAWQQQQQQQQASLGTFMSAYVAAMRGYGEALDEGMAKVETLGRDFDACVADMLTDAVKGNGLSDKMDVESGAAEEEEDETGAVPRAMNRVKLEPGEGGAVPDAMKEKLLELQEEFSKTKRSGKLPDQALALLKEWWSANETHPYPTEADKKQLIEATGLESMQINNWFINQRKRHWKAA
ncbi:hypothetical protein FOA52_010745 [Chlamydomonas sp. UWO 241]|nr:hypothetical protein FOA52_010745 [Chlamydomonas sp. UWO 241]